MNFNANDLSVQTYVGCLEFLRESLPESAFGQMGINKTAANLLTSEKLWSAQDTMSIEATLKCLTDGFSRIQLWKPYEIPAEHLAAIISTFVHPKNVRAACYLVANSTASAAQLASGLPQAQCETVSDVQLFALLLQARAQTADYETSFNVKTKNAVDMVSQSQELVDELRK